MKKILYLAAGCMLMAACTKNPQMKSNRFILDNVIQATVDSLVKKHGEVHLLRITRGVNQAASFWQASDGTAEAFSEFCALSFVSDSASLNKLFMRLSTNFEIIFGYSTKIAVDLNRPLQLDMGEILPVDEAFGSYSPLTHFADDFFSNRLAFVICLNFPFYSLREKEEQGKSWSRQQWAHARLGDMFDSRVTAAVNQEVVNAYTRNDMYIADYNIFAGQLVNDKGEKLFPATMKLLSHWNLRDEIKANYGRENGLARQQMIYAAMKRIISQEIPDSVINSDAYTWNPFTNETWLNDKPVTAEPEKDRRYAVLLDFFHAQQKVDPHYPQLNTFISRSFESDMEIPVADIEALFIEYLSAPVALEVAAVIKQRLGRELEPFDIWYDGFKPRTAIPAEVLDAKTRLKYPNRDAVQADLMPMLLRLGFAKEKASFLADHIQVDPARGSGHATGSETREQKSLLRTRIFADGMDYKGYNIAIHEFGHNVEQTISLHNVDNYMLHGVPNTAFTEALAFIFQKRDLRLLGIEDADPKQKYLDYLDNFWQLFEIMGVSLVDISTWQWLYGHPDATAIELRDAVNQIAADVWNKYYAPVFGIRDQPILAIYSHMINTPLYLPNYAYGHIIEFQIEEHLRGRDFGAEVERIYSIGRLIPQQWMREAVGAEISVQPIFNAVREALVQVGGQDLQRKD